MGSRKSNYPSPRVVGGESLSRRPNCLHNVGGRGWGFASSNPPPRQPSFLSLGQVPKVIHCVEERIVEVPIQRIVERVWLVCRNQPRIVQNVVI